MSAENIEETQHFLQRVRCRLKKYKFNKLYISLFYTLPFIILYIVSKLFLTENYLFEWTASHLYMYLWMIVMILAYREKYYMATMLNIANIVGLIVSEVLGNHLREVSIASITSDMSNQEIAEVHYHYGVVIWISTIIIIMLLAILMKFVKSKSN